MDGDRKMKNEKWSGGEERQGLRVYLELGLY